MDRRKDPRKFAHQLADYVPEVRAKALEIANQLLVDRTGRITYPLTTTRSW